MSWPPAVCAASVLLGCSFANDIDVCGTVGSEDQVNTDARGGQQIAGSAGVSALPNGNGYVVFVSAGGGVGRDFTTEVLGAAVNRDASLAPLCSTGPRTVQHAFRDDEGNLLHTATAAPRVLGGHGLVAYSQRLDDEFSLWASVVDDSGCRTPTDTIQRVAIAPADGVVDEPRILQTSDEIFTVFWREGTAGAGTLRARATRPGPVGFAFTSIVDPVTDEPRREGTAVDLFPPVAGLGPYDAALGDGRTLVAWQVADGTSAVLIQYAVFDETMRYVSPPQVVSRHPVTELADESDLSVRWHEDTFVLTWFERETPASPRRLMGQRIGSNGDLRGSSRPLTDGIADDEGPSVAMTSLARGLLVVWEESGGERPDRSGSRLVGRVFDARLRVRFTNPACGVGPFLINQGHDGDQTHVGAVTLDDGSALIAWTDTGDNGLDREETSIRASAWSLRDLFPEDSGE